jgi:uncharacterized membrane-anchored protein
MSSAYAITRAKIDAIGSSLLADARNIIKNEIRAIVKTRKPGFANSGGAIERRIATTMVITITIATVRSMLDVRSGLLRKNTT